MPAVSERMGLRPGEWSVRTRKDEGRRPCTTRSSVGKCDFYPPSPASPFPGILIHFHGFFSQMLLRPTFSAPSSPEPQTHPTAPRTPLRDASQACQASHVTLPKGSTSCSHSPRTRSCRSPAARSLSPSDLPSPSPPRGSLEVPATGSPTTSTPRSHWPPSPRPGRLSLKGCSWPFSSRPCQTF